MKYIPGEPPKSVSLSTPSVYCWAIRKSPAINSQSSLVFSDWEYVIKLGIKSIYKQTALEVDSSGCWSNQFEGDRKTPLEEAYLLEKILSYILEVDGYDNNWYYDFVQNGVLGERNRIRWDFTSFGGTETGSDILQFLTGYFTIRTWGDSSYQMAIGKLTVSVTDAVVASGRVWITDKNGNRIEDANGVNEWTVTFTAGSGSVTTADLPSQKTIIVHVAESLGGVKTGTTSGNIVNNTTTAISVALA